MRKSLLMLSAGIAFLAGCTSIHSTMPPRPPGSLQGQIQASTTPTSQAWHYRVLYSFIFGGTPLAGLVRDAAGNLYGTALLEGGGGSVFKVDPNGKESTVHGFGSPSDGRYPYGALIRDSVGNLYGTTYMGTDIGQGTVYKLDPSGNETILHIFSGYPTDGAYPTSSLVRDAAGNLYGTANNGGSEGNGCVFKLDPSGNLTLLHSFNGPDGQQPVAGLVQDAAGNLYGTTSAGYRGDGAVFKVDPSGNYTALHIFNGSDGNEPFGNLNQDAAGNLYGTTFLGGNSDNGVVFRLDPSGNETVLHDFNGIDGSQPYGGLVRDSVGNLYGTTSRGGRLNVGVVFKLDQVGNETILHSFSGLDHCASILCTDGAMPYSMLVLDSAGNLYGTTKAGGRIGHQEGVVFELSH